MGNSLSVRLCGIFQNKKEESWWERVTENARAFFRLRGTRAFPHGGAGGFDLLEARPVPGTRRRQAASLLVHGVVVAGLLFLGGSVVKRPAGDSKPPFGEKPLLVRFRGFFLEDKPDGGGKGSNHDLLAPTSGILAPRSPIVLLRPHLPAELTPVLPVEPTVFDANAAMPTQQVRDLGLPWRKDRNNSNGNDGGNSMGTKGGDSTGSRDGDEEGELSGGRYSPGAYPVKCAYCPEPEYTDEARHEKLQGSVTLRVLVTADGRAGQVKIVKGLGFGLDERAMEKVRAWRFEPARDSDRKAITQWVTVEATYRLF
jgi:TonB family protein